MTDYKKHSLDQLDNWLHDCISCDDITPQEVYDTIKKVVEEQYYYFKHHTGRCYELLALLNNNGQSYEDAMKEKEYHEPSTSPSSYHEMIAAGYEMTADGFWIKESKEDKVVKWQLPVQVDGLSGECYINLPDDLLEVANLKEGDTVKWVDNKNGTYTMIKHE